MAKILPLKPNQVAEILAADSNLLKVELNALPVEILSWHFDPNEWCIKQVLGHLIETEKNGFAKRIPLMIKIQDPQLISLDQVKEAVVRNDCEQDAIKLLNKFISLRKKSYIIVESLKNNDIHRGAWHPDAGYLTIGDLLHEWIYHDLDHIRQITDIIQRYVWGHLGATQGWYKHLTLTQKKLLNARKN